METEIKVIEDVKSTADIANMPKDERDMFFEQLADACPSVDKYHFSSFSEMAVSSLQFANSLNKPELKELLLRKLVQLSYGIGSHFNTVVIPIIPSLNNINIKRNKGAAIPTAPTVPKTNASTVPKTNAPKIGSYSQKRQQHTVVTKIDRPHAIKVRFDTPILTFTEHGLDYISAPNEELEIIGLIVNPICARAKVIFDKNNNGPKPIPVTAVAINQPTHNSIVFSFIDVIRSCKSLFNIPKPILSIQTRKIDNVYKIFFAGLPETSLHELLENIFDYLTTYYELQKGELSSVSVDSIYNQLELALRGLSNNEANTSASATSKGETPSKGGPATGENPAKKSSFGVGLSAIASELAETKPTEVSHILDHVVPKDDILDMLASVYKNKFTMSTNGAMIADLAGLGLLNIWMRAKLHGKDSKEVKDSIKNLISKQQQKEFQLEQKLLLVLRIIMTS